MQGLFQTLCFHLFHPAPRTNEWTNPSPREVSRGEGELPARFSQPEPSTSQRLEVPEKEFSVSSFRNRPAEPSYAEG